MTMARLLLAATLAIASCTPQNRGPVTHADPQPAEEIANSGKLAAEFPLLPMIEKSLWHQLLEAEAKLLAAEAPARPAIHKDVDRLTEKLRGRHPFNVSPGQLVLGGIVFDKLRGRITLPARVHYPDPGDARHPGELELLLCTESGRSHETLFVTTARPLHLELLLHLTGHAKGPQGRRFRIEVLTQEGERIPVDSLIRVQGKESVKFPLRWEFSGSDYNDTYAPDLSGDFAIFWHAHDAVLRVDHEGIASGVVKLAAVPHPMLNNGMQVVLEMIPDGPSDPRGP